MLTSDFSYDLPEELIAQEPVEPRDSCRLLVLGRKDGSIEHRVFSDIIDYLEPGDLLVVNETRVLPARLLGFKRGTGGRAEVFLLRQLRPDTGDGTARWEGLVKPGKRLKPGAVVEFFDKEGCDPDTGRPHPDAVPVLEATVADWADGSTHGMRIIDLKARGGSFDDAIHAAGTAPLPPYIHGYRGDMELYQTVYSRNESSAAAPTAGLHFTQELLDAIAAKGVEFATVELEIGLDTFRIVETERAEDHPMHSEVFHISQETIDAIEAAKARGSRVVAVGTTSMRALESAWDEEQGRLVATDGKATSLFILPGYEFHVPDALVTNFHIPRSTLMMLVSAFSTREHIMNAYRTAIEERYRMLSFGDAMLII